MRKIFLGLLNSTLVWIFLMAATVSVAVSEPVVVVPLSSSSNAGEKASRIAIPGSSTAAQTYTISESGSYYLTGDRLCSGTGILVNADNVTIDLMGNSLIGPGNDSDNGIHMDGRDNVEIRNGTIRNFYYGIIEYKENLEGHRVFNVRLIENLRSGMTLLSFGNIVKNCTANNNGAIGMGIGLNSVITGNVAYSNGYSATTSAVYGIYAYGNSIVKDNIVSDNGTNASKSVYGIYAIGNGVVQGNTVYSNGSRSDGSAVYGIYAGSGSTVINNSVRGNGVSTSATVYGIYLQGRNLVDQNTSYDNGYGSNNISLCHTCVYGQNVGNPP